jgi:hypothetical protein
MATLCLRVVAAVVFASELLLSACDTPLESRHVAFPEVTTRSGALLSPLRIVTIVAENDSLDARAFFDFSAGVGSSRWWNRIAPEYHLQTVTDAAHLLGPPITTDVSDHDVFTYISSAVETSGGSARDGHTLYLLYLPPGINVVQKGTVNTGCAKFGGYHARFGTLGDNLAVVQRCFETFPIENMTIAASHEIVEAATDPDGLGYALPGIAARLPWTEAIWNAVELEGHAELGDLCESTFWVEGASVYQRIWSNIAARAGGDPCIPELVEPFYDSSFAEDWYPVSAGGMITIPVTGWTTGPMPTWGLAASLKSDVLGFSATFGDAPNNTLAEGRTANLAVGAPATAMSGTFAVIRVSSKRPGPIPGSRSLTDGAHVNYVGVYVP